MIMVGHIDNVAEYATDWTYVHDAKNKYHRFKNKLLVYGGSLKFIRLLRVVFSSQQLRELLRE